MSTTLFTSASERLHVTSFTGPANTLERTRVRVQFEIVSTSDMKLTEEVTLAELRGYDEAQSTMSLGFNEIAALHQALGRWIAEHKDK